MQPESRLPPIPDNLPPIPDDDPRSGVDLPGRAAPAPARRRHALLPGQPLYPPVSPARGTRLGGAESASAGSHGRPGSAVNEPERPGPSRRILVAGTLGSAGLVGAALAVAWRGGALDTWLSSTRSTEPVTATGSTGSTARAVPRTGEALGAAAPPEPATGIPSASAGTFATLTTATTGIAPTTSPSAVAIDALTGLPLTTHHGISATGGGTAVAAPVPLRRDVPMELVLSRVTYGATPALRTEIEKTGLSAWLGHQLAPASLADPKGDAVAAMYPALGRTPQSLWAEHASTKGSPADAPHDLQAAHLGRAIWSRRQLLEVMVDFWSNHFNVPVTIVNARLTRADYDRTVIRNLALGRFEDLLVAAAHHPAMLTYRNLAGSAGSTPNENFARELMELHTVGIDGGYTETDVTQAARLLTGLVLTPNMAVRYEPSRHFVGAITVMDFRHANADAAGGPEATRAFLGYLARHPSTATLLATKLARRFVSDAPPARLVRTLAAVYLASGTAIVPVLRALFASPEFAAGAGAKLRRPMEHLVAVARAVGLRPGTDPKSLRDVVWWLDAAGHKPFAWPAPDGYPDVSAAWQSAGPAIAQFADATALVRGWGPTGFGHTEPVALLSNPAGATTAAAITAQLARRIFGRPPTEAERTGVATILSAPSFLALPPGSRAQTEATALAAVLLFHSPAFLTR